MHGHVQGEERNRGRRGDLKFVNMRLTRMDWPNMEIMTVW